MGSIVPFYILINIREAEPRNINVQFENVHIGAIIAKTYYTL